MLGASTRRLALCAIGVLGCVLAGCGSTRTVEHVQRVITVERAAPRSTPAAGGSPTLSDLLERVQSGIVRIESEQCGGMVVGTGFELSPRIVATVEHVVDGASAIRLEQGDRLVATATIIGSDPGQDLALLLTDRSLEGHALRLAARQPQLGEEVAAIGFPLDLPLSVTQGTISGLGRTIPIDNYARHNLIQTDAALNPGNSGGPLISIKTSEVVGLVDLKDETANGLGFAVSSSVALNEFTHWKSKPEPVHAVGCPTTPAVPAPSTQLPPLFLLPPQAPSTGDPGPPTSGGNSGGEPTPGNEGNTGNTGDTGPGNTGNTGSGDTGSGNSGAGDTGSGNTGNTGPGDTGSGNTGTGDTGTPSTSTADPGSTGNT
jgi:hypothetical protein